MFGLTDTTCTIVPTIISFITLNENRKERLLNWNIFKFFLLKFKQQEWATIYCWSLSCWMRETLVVKYIDLDKEILPKKPGEKKEMQTKIWTSNGQFIVVWWPTTYSSHFSCFHLYIEKLCLELIVLVCFYFSKNRLEASYCIYNLLSRVNKEMIKYNSINVVYNSLDNSCKTIYLKFCK